MLPVWLGFIGGLLAVILGVLLRILNILLTAPHPHFDDEKPRVTTSKPAPHVPPAENERPVVFIVECGNCGKTIESGPIGSVVSDTETSLSYMCEHCGTSVTVTE